MDIAQALGAAAAALVLGLQGMGASPFESAAQAIATAQSQLRPEMVREALAEFTAGPRSKEREELRAVHMRFAPDVRVPMERL